MNQFVIFEHKEYLVVEDQGEIVWISDKYGEEFGVYKKDLQYV